MYTGRLFYEGEKNYIDVHRFVKREGGGSIQLTTTWDASGSYKLDTILHRNGDTFTTGKVHFKNSVGKSYDSVTEIEFTITDEYLEGGKIRIRGVLREDGESYIFQGNLVI